eukprot:scaffold173285_cov38-Prasinocladus_malaysianus.AAC.2
MGVVGRWQVGHVNRWAEVLITAISGQAPSTIEGNPGPLSRCPLQQQQPERSEGTMHRRLA